MLIEAQRLLLGKKFSEALEKLLFNDLAHATSDNDRTRERVPKIVKAFGEKVAASKTIKKIAKEGLSVETTGVTIRPRIVNKRSLLVIDISGHKFIFEEQEAQNGGEKKLVFIDVDWGTD